MDSRFHENNETDITVLSELCILKSVRPMSPLIFPSLDPVALSIGPLVIRWYALAYLAGFIIGWQLCLYLARQNTQGPKPELFDEFLSWGVLGTILGGRLGYVLFYQAEFYAANPLDIFKVWHGGMSFHGGMIGVMGAAWLYTRRHKISFLKFTDILAIVTPIGLGLGRVANFVNGELFGRVTDSPWGMIFPRGGELPRHPSQLYEAMLEGVILFLIMFVLSKDKKIRARPGLLSGCFLTGYSIFRFTCEFFREPDAQLGFLYAGATMGQILCIPMFLFGLYLMFRSERRVKKRDK
jgi:phosphatidylglycerol:prolipoprotein diacylglycerol transferase